MPALDLTGTDPCSLLNKTGFPTLWLSDSSATTAESLDSTIFASAGTMKTYVDSVTALKTAGDLNKNILANPSMTSEFSLIQFLSNGSLAQFANNPGNQNAYDYSKLQNIVLKTDAQIYGIVDSYIVGSQGISKAAYATGYSTDSTKLLSETDFWNSADVNANGTLKQNPTSILGCLLRDEFLIKARELYIPDEFSPGTTYQPPPGEESLIFLYRLAQKGTSYLTPVQQNRKSYLETKNLRFFGAFLAEYCFYRTRYELLLKQYFMIYAKPKTGSGAYVAPASTLKVFTTGTQSPVTQQEYLKQLAKHLAILNTRLTDLRKLLGSISRYYNGVYQSIQQTINSNDQMGSNIDLVNRITTLNESAVQAQKYLADLDFHEGVMSYNAEKNRYGNIMLGLYAFLNIAAVAAILQISNS